MVTVVSLFCISGCANNKQSNADWATEIEIIQSETETQTGGQV